MKTKNRAMLVYQAGIANVFEVDCFNMSGHGRVAQRLLQSDFRTCENFARGLGAAGVIVRTASCNLAGDIIDALWVDGLADCPFRSEAYPVNLN